MSTQTNQYIVVAMRFDFFEDYEKWHGIFEPFEDSAYSEIKHHNGLCVMADGRDGEFIFIGRVLKKTKEGQWFEEQYDLYSLVPTEEERQLLAALIGVTFPDLPKPLPDVKLWMFTYLR